MPNRATIDQKHKILEDLLVHQDERILGEFQERIDMSWIYHDSALEGSVLSFHELESASVKKKIPLNQDLLRRLHEMLGPEDAEAREGLWRKETPVHRLYFHDIAAPDKIPAEMKKLND